MRGGRPSRERLPAWLPDVAVGILVLLYGVADVTNQFAEWRFVPDGTWLVIIGSAVSAALFRHTPGGALLALWITSAILVLSSTPLLAVQLVVVLVGFGTARYGTSVVVWLSGLSIPVGSFIAVLVVMRDGYAVVARIYDPFRSVYGGDQIGTVTLVAVGFIVFAVPWLVGLLIRSLARTEEVQERRAVAEALQHEAEAGLAQAREIAELRAAQARLANDVHDVVGHSLAVILAQAESAQFLGEDETDRIRETLEHVATSARQSLQDVRAVLSSTDAGAAAGSATAGLDSLIDGLVTSGHDLRTTVFGSPQPLPPELESVAFRVLQEMLTNALRHGRRGAPVLVERDWAGELRIDVRNTVEPGEPSAGSNGLGIEGMRRRLESVGGRLDVRRRDDVDGSTFTATAWIPLRSVSS